MTKLARTILSLVALLFLGNAAQAQTFPKFSGFVVDAADVLPPETEAELTAKLDALQRETKRQLVVATIPDLQGYPLEDYGNRLLRAWGVGLKDVNNGAILFIAPNEPAGHRGPRIEVGYGLEPILTDALSSIIINEQMMPRLKAGDVSGAMTAGTDAIVAQLRAAPEEAKARTDAAVAEFDRTHQVQRKQSGRSGGSNGIPFGLIFWGVILLFVVLPMLGRGFGGRGRRGPWGGRRYRSGGSDWPIVLWSIANEIGRESSRGGWGGGSGGGGWGGGGDWGGGGGGGGFSGGGGSGGGGGASGSW